MGTKPQCNLGVGVRNCGVVLHSRVTIDNNYVWNISKAQKKDIKYFTHEEMITL